MPKTKHKRRFGFTAIELGYITLDQLIETMIIQVKEELLSDRYRLIGEILIELGLMTPEQVDEVVQVQVKAVIDSTQMKRG